LYDVNNTAYVGKYFEGFVWRIARVQVSQPNRGIYLIKNGKLVNFPSGGYYLADNPNNHYYWIDLPEIISTATNAVTVKQNEQYPTISRVGRVQIDGQLQIGTANELGLANADEKGDLRYARSYQILVCDPRPANQCSEF
jgi:hypothetical protein